MSVGKFLLLAGVIFLAILWIKRRPPRQSTPHRKNPLQTTVRCAQCQVFLPAAQAIKQKNNYFCPQHRDRSAEG